MPNTRPVQHHHVTRVSSGTGTAPDAFDTELAHLVGVREVSCHAKPNVNI